ncbi:hypothetical protein [Streptomyces sp. NEAU-W12]|uniref:hypothetical protein n=1 Tax=Streptomyces sp. NEAU-W12 TaxID=2994668 RepID=UPI00224AA9D3|nr:hypothetical protein [Streptomyces sp. NEAU-W12]
MLYDVEGAAAGGTGVPQAEAIRAFRVPAQPFTEEHGLLTPSLKLRRRAVERAYAEEAEVLYRA